MYTYSDGYSLSTRSFTLLSKRQAVITDILYYSYRIKKKSFATCVVKLFKSEIILW